VKASFWAPLGRIAFLVEVAITAVDGCDANI